MKLGLTGEERRRIEELERQSITAWHKKFAWFPVYMEDTERYVWLETYWRQFRYYWRAGNHGFYNCETAWNGGK